MADTDAAGAKPAKTETYVALVHTLDAKGKLVPPGTKLKLTPADAEALPAGAVKLAKGSDETDAA